MKIKSLACAALAIGLLFAGSTRAQQPGGSGGQEPSWPGANDDEQFFLQATRVAAGHGKRSVEYVQSLIELGMYYNRHEQFKDAARVLAQALSIVDGGALRPTPPGSRVPDKITEHHDQGGTVSATIERTPMPYEETMHSLLPQLVAAEIGSKSLRLAETHVKRFIALPAANDVEQKVNLMSAYSQYAEILRKLNRPAEAAEYQKKVEQINASFKPL